MAQLTDYTGLITSEHQPRPNYMAVVSASVQPFVDIINVVSGIPTDFDLDAAVGVQLDALGAWAGVSRNITVPSTNSVTVLPDSTFRLLVKAKIAANKWDGTTQGAASILAILYGPSTNVAFKDNQDMSFDMLVAGIIPSAALLAILSTLVLPLKPSGVRVNNRWVTTGNGAPIFGLDIENSIIAGLDVGAWATTF
ncbi:hypothetical protein QF001_000944 [Paraburkholderia youngii]|uniref:DUF2612 domain-containing protein n=1 Tax=Paraburkholderia youngii TaxID=2782701 RepID=UPI003D19B74C